MEHKITFRAVSGKDGDGKPFSGYIADCSCYWGWPSRPMKEDFYPLIIAHYRQHGMILG